MTLGTYRTLILALGDVTLLWLGLVATLLVRYGLSGFGIAFALHAIPFSIVFGIWILVFYIAGLYSVSGIHDTIYTFKILIYSILIGGTVTIILFYFVPLFLITPKINLFINLAFTSLLLIFWRNFFSRLIKTSTKIKVLLVGSSPDIEELAATIHTYPQLGYEIRAQIGIGENIMDHLAGHTTNIVVAPREIQSNTEFVHAIYEALQRGIRFIDTADFYEIIMGKISVSLISKVWFLENIAEAEKIFFESTKRTIDIVFALLLGAITLPFFPIVALLIQLDTRGPILLRQRRVGRMGKIYTHYKYRTMIVLGSDGHAEPDGAVWSQENDSRVTRAGRILRATRIDELPQLWNVLRGELSFIGPRPERPEFVEQLRKNVPFYDMRHLVRPGLSGWAQINPPFYYASTKDTVLKLQYDLFYIKNRDLGLDLSIALKTLMVILSRQGR